MKIGDWSPGMVFLLSGGRGDIDKSPMVKLWFPLCAAGTRNCDIGPIILLILKKEKKMIPLQYLANLISPVYMVFLGVLFYSRCAWSIHLTFYTFSKFFSGNTIARDTNDFEARSSGLIKECTSRKINSNKQYTHAHIRQAIRLFCQRQTQLCLIFIILCRNGARYFVFFSSSSFPFLIFFFFFPLSVVYCG